MKKGCHTCSVEFGCLSVVAVWFMLQFGKPGVSDRFIQGWWNWSHDLWQLLIPSTKSIAALSVYPSKMNSGFLGLVFLALSPHG